jgi:hypothetical protein
MSCSVIKGRTYFTCAACNKVVDRKSATKDLVRAVLLEGWDCYRSLNKTYEFCDNPKCQSILDDMLMNQWMI